MNTDGLKGIIPDSVLNALPNVINNYGCNTPLRLAHFLSECQHESQNFTKVYENLNYSAEALQSLFKSHFPNGDEANYARQPEKIANRIYANRMGNGDEESGDGWKYRGRGYLQMTGADNYAAFNETVDEDIEASPDLVATKYPLESAAFFFQKNNIWAICDAGSSVENITAVRRRVNGGIIGLQDVINNFNKIYPNIS